MGKVVCAGSEKGVHRSRWLFGIRANAARQGSDYLLRKVRPHDLGRV